MERPAIRRVEHGPRFSLAMLFLTVTVVCITCFTARSAPVVSIAVASLFLAISVMLLFQRSRTFINIAYLLWLLVVIVISAFAIYIIAVLLLGFSGLLGVTT